MMSAVKTLAVGFVLASWLGARVLLATSGELSEAQWKELRAGRHVVITRTVPGEPWPQVTIYAWCLLSPEELAAVFFDYESACRFVPNVLQSEIRARRSTCEMDVAYVLDIPLLADEHYTARNTLSPVPGGGFSVRWKLLEARYTKASTGEFRVIPFEGGTLARYQALTTPSPAIVPPLAKLLRGHALAQMRETFHALLREAERLRAKEPSGLHQRVQRLRSAIGAIE